MAKINRHYVSDIDLFLAEFDKEHPTLSLSQEREITKNKRIAEKRDTAMPAVKEALKVPLVI